MPRIGPVKSVTYLNTPFPNSQTSQPSKLLPPLCNPLTQSAAGLDWKCTRLNHHRCPNPNPRTAAPSKARPKESNTCYRSKLRLSLTRLMSDLRKGLRITRTGQGKVGHLRWRLV